MRIIDMPEDIRIKWEKEWDNDNDFKDRTFSEFMAHQFTTFMEMTVILDSNEEFREAKTDKSKIIAKMEAILGPEKMMLFLKILPLAQLFRKSAENPINK